MRFDDSLRTVLSGETASGAGAQAAWRQLVDLVGRGRVAPDAAALGRLRKLREVVPASVRAASARALAFAQPPAELVALFGEDSLEIAAPVLRTATLDSADWEIILPRLTPAGRSVLRHRRDLPADTARALAAFGATDFVLSHDAPAVGAAEAVEPEPTTEMPAAVKATAVVEPLAAPAQTPAPGPETPRFEIADLVARIDAFNRTRERPRAAAAPPEPVRAADSFRFETDATATVRWVEGVTRTPLVGLALGQATRQSEAQVDGGVAGACRRRSAFRDARLLVGGTSDAAGAWRLSGEPAFDRASGRFLGYRGTARRPRADESASPAPERATSDSLRQLVHELRTPTNAIAGFAELIETELLGPVPEPYLSRATAIRHDAGALVQAIDDLDTAARIDGGALELRPAAVALHPVVARALAQLEPLCALRHAAVSLLPDGEEARVLADDRALERLVGRLLAALVSSAGAGEPITLALAQTGDTVTLVADKPAGLGTAEDVEGEGAPLLGTAFALRLAGNLASELGGKLLIDAARLTLRLPAAVDRTMGQASTN